MEEKKRDFGLDLVRAVAILCVLCVHFYAYTPFLSTPFGGWNLFLQGTIYILFSSGVPLFLLLTGYLNVYKQPETKYYKRIVKIILSYLFISVITWFVLSKIHGQKPSITSLLKGILDFSIIGYAWYIEMYIGLFLLTPFLNMIWQGCAQKRNNVLLLLVTLLFVSSLPCVINRHEIRILPQYWACLWVLLYYFTGAAIRQFFADQRPSLFSRHIFLCFLILAGCCSFNSFFTILVTPEKRYLSLTGIDSSPFAWLIAMIVFLALYRVKEVKYMHFITHGIAKYSLDIYLFSYMFDQLIYPWVMKHLFVSQSQIFAYYIPIVGSVLLCSLAAAVLKEKLFSGAHFIWLKVYENRHRS